MNVRLSRCATDWGNERATFSLASVVRCLWGERPPNRCGHQKMRESLFNTLAVEQKKRSHERLTQGALLVSIDGAELVLSELKRIKIEGQFIVGACEHVNGLFAADFVAVDYRGDANGVFVPRLAFLQ